MGWVRLSRHGNGVQRMDTLCGFGKVVKHNRVFMHCLSKVVVVSYSSSSLALIENHPFPSFLGKPCKFWNHVDDQVHNLCTS